VVMNLAVNARDAMPDGGRLLIRAAPGTMGEGEGEERACALLEVADTGTGIRDDAMEHLFEPFFTTKEVGKGTGLGLATVYGIVTQSGGVVDVSSEPGRGATFRVRLPAAPGGEAAVPGAAAGNGASARVLLVEDEAAVRGLVRRILQRHGYEVLEAEDGAVALELVERAPDLRLVVSDVVMPRMNGPELQRKLAELRPELPFLFISGYSHEELGDAGPPPDTAYLSKPFTPQQLLEEVGALIG
ncbi:MAG: ATP-binding protein, partial [Longimicrobiales bacterium]